MQLVSDCVVMFDTMKDRRIGIPEVVEKFGVLPGKMIEVQALIGDSTDNVPGVPGIGPKTAAQLIGEYGDLETLLARAGEIKQEKRRQSLIDNADYKKLIAFLKAMEFNSITRRVAEISGLAPAAVEPDARLAGGRPAGEPA